MLSVLDFTHSNLDCGDFSQTQKEHETNTNCMQLFKYFPLGQNVWIFCVWTDLDNALEIHLIQYSDTYIHETERARYYTNYEAG